jgi:hypothetical protein
MKRLPALLLLPLVLLIVNVCNAQSVGEPQLSFRDKAAIVQLAMELKLKSEGPLKFSQHLVFRAGEMSQKLLPKIPGFEIRLMKPAAIQKRTLPPEGFKFLDIAFSQKGDFIVFDLYIIERRGGLPMHSHVYQYVFSKAGGVWQGKLLMIIC